MSEEIIITLYCVSHSGGLIPLSGFTAPIEPVALENVLEDFAGEWVSPCGAITITMPSQNYQLKLDGAEDIESYGLFLMSSLVALSEPAIREAHRIAIQDDPVGVEGKPIAQVYQSSHSKLVLSSLDTGNLALTWTLEQQAYIPGGLKSIAPEIWIAAASEALSFYADFLELVLVPYYKDAGLDKDDYIGISRQIVLGRLLLAR